MGFHKHGVFSFTVDVQRIGLIAGDNFVADVTALRRHRPNGSADKLLVPAMSEEYGATAPQAEARAIRSMQQWLTHHSDSAATRLVDVEIAEY